LTTLGLHERRHTLSDLIRDQTGQIRLSEAFEGDGDTLFAEAVKLGIEGIVAKNDDRPYRSGRTGDWIKIKVIQSDSFAIVGYEPSTKVPGAVASLLLAARKGKELVYAGSVGNGLEKIGSHGVWAAVGQHANGEARRQTPKQKIGFR